MFHVKPQDKNKIDQYITLLKEYNSHTNIYSKGAYDKLPYHINDCITLAEIIPKQAKTIIDFGSGSGLPAIIISLLLPQKNIIAIESKSKKTTFLIKTKTALELNNLEIAHQDINHYLKKTTTKIDIITAKAFAHISKTTSIIKKGTNHRPLLIVPISQRQLLEYQELDNSLTFIKKNDYTYCTKQF